mmetsp:Transcript_14268/g.19850  ORF Transcript_14268/g.19850 Transcript_14268/m.19850 type:complete len:104 (+) Transcript_14268:1516-1827(+)
MLQLTRCGKNNFSRLKEMSLRARRKRPSDHARFCGSIFTEATLRAGAHFWASSAGDERSLLISRFGWPLSSQPDLIIMRLMPHGVCCREMIRPIIYNRNSMPT